MNKILTTLVSTALFFGAFNVYAADAQKDVSADSKTQVVAEEVKVKVSNAFAKPSLSGSKNTALFLNIKNTGDSNLTIVDVSASDVANSAEIHATKTDSSGVSKMEKISSLDLPAKQEVEFKSGGNHVMLIDLKKELKEGDSFEASVVLKEIGSVKFNVVVKK